MTEMKNSQPADTLTGTKLDRIKSSKVSHIKDTFKGAKSIVDMVKPKTIYHTIEPFN